MNMDDDVLADLLTEHAAGVQADPLLLTTVRSRARRRRARRALLAAACTAAAAVAATVVISGPAEHGTGQATLLPGTGVPALTPAAPPFPLTPTHLPDGLGPARTLMVAGQTVLRYDPAGQVDSRAAITIQVGATTPAGVLASRPSTPTTILGQAAQILSVASGVTTVVFNRQPSQVVAVTGNDAYADGPVLVAVAASLADRPIAATLPFTIADLPAAVGPLIAYDQDSMSFGADPDAPALAVTFTPGIDAAPTGAVVVPSSPVGSPVARVVDGRHDGLLELVSSVLSADQLLQLAPHVTTADSGAVTPLPARTIATAPSALPSAGPQPPDPATAVDEVQAAFHTAFTHVPNQAPYASLATVEDGAALHGTLDQLRRNFAQAAQTASVTTGKPVFTSPTTASVEFTLTYTGGMPYGTQLGRAVLTNGTWLVSRDTYCQVMAFGGASCPAG